MPKEIKKWMTDDGKEFDSEREAIHHENAQAIIKTVNSAARGPAGELPKDTYHVLRALMKHGYVISLATPSAAGSGSF